VIEAVGIAQFSPIVFPETVMAPVRIFPLSSIRRHPGHPARAIIPFTQEIAGLAPRSPVMDLMTDLIPVVDVSIRHSA